MDQNIKIKKMPSTDEYMDTKPTGDVVKPSDSADDGFNEFLKVMNSGSSSAKPTESTTTVVSLWGWISPCLVLDVCNCDE